MNLLAATIALTDSADIEGISGSWIVREGKFSTKVYGQVVAKDPFGDLYIVPMKQILNEIANVFGAEMPALQTHSLKAVKDRELLQERRSRPLVSQDLQIITARNKDIDTARIRVHTAIPYRDTSPASRKRSIRRSRKSISPHSTASLTRAAHPDQWITKYERCILTVLLRGHN